MKLLITKDGYPIACDEGIEIPDSRPATTKERELLVSYMTALHEAAKAEGAKAHHISATGVAVDGGLTLTLTMEPGAQATGDRFIEQVRDALALTDDQSRNRALGRLVDLDRRLVLRLADVHAYLNQLWSKGMISAIKGILGERRRGRPRENVVTQVAIVSDLKRRKLWTKDMAEVHARRFTKTVAAVENDHAKFRKLLDLYGSRYVNSDVLMEDVWHWPASISNNKKRRPRNNTR